VNTYEIASRSAGEGVFPWRAASADAATMIRPINAAHSVHVAGADGGAGIALAEIYDLRVLPALPPVEVFDLVGFARRPTAPLAEMPGGGEQGADYHSVDGTGNYWQIEADTSAEPRFAERFRTALGGDQPLIVEINTTIDLSVFGVPDTALNRSAVAHPELIPDGSGDDWSVDYRV